MMLFSTDSSLLKALRSYSYARFSFAATPWFPPRFCEN